MHIVRSLLRALIPAATLFAVACGAPGLDDHDVGASASALTAVEDPTGPPVPVPAPLPNPTGKIHGHDRGSLHEACDPSLPSPCKGSLVCCYPCGVEGCVHVCMAPDVQGQCPMRM